MTTKITGQQRERGEEKTDRQLFHSYPAPANMEYMGAFTGSFSDPHGSEESPVFSLQVEALPPAWSWTRILVCIGAFFKINNIGSFLPHSQISERSDRL